MPTPPKPQLAGTGKALVEGPADAAGTFEGIPKIRKVAGDSAGQRCKGKVVIITGANSPLGIGRASAHQFAENGARAIFICDLNGDKLDTHKREIESLYAGVEIHPRQFDASDEKSVEAVVHEALEKYGRLDVFFANAGMASAKVFYDYTADEFMNMIRVNTLRYVMEIHAALGFPNFNECVPRRQVRFQSNDENVTSEALSLGIHHWDSVSGRHQEQCRSHRLLGLESSGDLPDADVCLSACRYWHQVQRHLPWSNRDGHDERHFRWCAEERGTAGKIGQVNPTKRGAVADEIARVALFLGSDEASYVNGQAWAVCGGLSAGHPYVMGKLA